MTEPYRKSSLRDTFESLVVTVILAIFGTTFVVQAFKIPTGSMENTLLVGDHLLVNKFAFARQGGWLRRMILPYREIHRDDVVVFKYPYPQDQTQEPGEHFVKRVIGVPGDHVKLVNRQVYVNGQPVKEPFDNFENPSNMPVEADNFPPTEGNAADYLTPRWAGRIEHYIKNGEIVVPPEKYFVMGDHRELSWDSRFWGFVPRDLIAGRPLIIYWSFETPEQQYERTSLSDRASQTFDLIVHFFSKTRWRRTFKLVH